MQEAKIKLKKSLGSKGSEKWECKTQTNFVEIKTSNTKLFYARLQRTMTMELWVGYMDRTIDSVMRLYFPGYGPFC